ncbi:MAG: hypothetical protein AAGA65_09465 [Actinomycetota bacterium]
MDTNIVWQGALAPKSYSAQLHNLLIQVNFYVAATTRHEIAARIAKSVPDPHKAAGVADLVERFTHQVKAIDIPDAGPGVDGDVIIAKTARSIDAVVCTYNLDHFPETITPFGLLRASDLSRYYVEYPVRQDEATLAYFMRLYDDTDVQKLLRFEDGLEVFGMGGRRLAVRLSANDQSKLITSQVKMPDSEEFALVIRFNKAKGLRADCWHPSGTRHKPWRTESCGNYRLVTTGPLVGHFWLDRLGRPSNADSFGVSAAPGWLKDSAIARGVRVGTLEASFNSDDVDELFARVQVRHIDGGFMTILPTGESTTTFGPATGWRKWESE